MHAVGTRADDRYLHLAVPRYVPARVSASTIVSTAISFGSYSTVLISRKPRNPFSTRFTPCSPSRAAFPTSYQAT